MKRAYEHSNQSFVLSASQTRRTSGNDLETTKNCKTEEFDLFAEIKTRSTRIDSFLFDCIRCFISCYMETEGFFFLAIILSTTSVTEGSVLVIDAHPSIFGFMGIQLI